MIFVALGNSPVQFDRLAEAVDLLARNLNEDVYVQTGFTSYNYKYARSVDFLNQELFTKNLQNSRVTILQGGWGGIAEASALGCKIIAVPRIKGKEHHHDQVQLVEALEKEGVLIGCYDVDKLFELVEKARYIEFKPIKRGDANRIINEFIQHL